MFESSKNNLPLLCITTNFDEVGKNNIFVQRNKQKYAKRIQKD